MNFVVAVGRVYGRLSIPLAKLFARRLEEILDHLVVQAVERWAAASWERYDDQEVNCTVQIYRHACAVSASDALLSVSLECVEVTRAVLEGKESAKSSGRADIRLAYGKAGVAVECKRVSLSDGLPKKYVNEGMARFVRGRYSESEWLGGMIGYIQADEVYAIVDAINSSVDQHAQMGPAHRLKEDRSLIPIIGRYSSMHERGSLAPMNLAHYMVDMSKRGTAWSEGRGRRLYGRPRGRSSLRERSSGRK